MINNVWQMNKEKKTKKWWQNAVIYQIYPRSFADSNGDGIGDLQGIISKMDYLVKLGVDAIWLSPVFRSPQDDNGYDISDYRDIDSMFGSLEDMENLISEAKKHSLFWNNHDLPRIVSRWGNDQKYRVESAKMLAILLHGMQGTPYIYQGEELGMTNAQYEIEKYRDIETLNLYKQRLKDGYDKDSIMKSIHAKSRDNARTPMQWDDTENAGFTMGEPWMQVNPNYKEINAKQQMQDINSVFFCYKKLIRLRKEYSVFVDGDFRMLLEEDKNIFAYIRRNETSELVVICNFYDKVIRYFLPETIQTGKMLIGNYQDAQKNVMRPYEARMYFRYLETPEEK